MINNEKKFVKCPTCGKKYPKSNSNCCWGYCYESDCDSRQKFCLNCGGTNIFNNGDDYDYVCNLQCNDCGQSCCGMCE